jgi:hypothetical protein
MSDSETNKQLKYCKDLHKWSGKWMILNEDLEYGNELVEEFEPFILWLINKNYTKKTIKRHCNNLWVLGAEIISSINIDSDLREISAKKHLSDSINDTGGPYTNYLETENEEEQFDATCRKLHKFISDNKR